MMNLRTVSAAAGAVVFVSTIAFAQGAGKNPAALLEQQQQAQARAREAAKKSEIADFILTQRETAAGRVFDADFKSQLKRDLLSLPVDKLEAFNAGGGLGDVAAVLGQTGVQSLGDATADLVFTPLTPCRIVDTRNAGGIIPANTTRDFRVWGTTGFDTQGGVAAGCGIPQKATAVEMNYVSVLATGSGDLRAYPFGAAQPLAAVLNYGNPAGLFAIANGIAQPICNNTPTICTADLTILAESAPTHVVIDVVGYYALANKAQVKSFVTTSQTQDTTFLTNTCTHYSGGVVTVTAPAGVAGKALVRAHAILQITHVTGTTDFIEYTLGTTATDCSILTTVPGYGNIAYEASALPTATYVSTGTVFQVFDVAAGATASFFLNGLTTGRQPFLYIRRHGSDLHSQLARRSRSGTDRGARSRTEPRGGVTVLTK